MNVFVSNLHIKKTLPLNDLDLYCLDNLGEWGNISMLMWNMGNNSLIFSLMLDLLIQKLISYPHVNIQQIQRDSQFEVISWKDKLSKNQFLWMQEQLAGFQKQGIHLEEKSGMNLNYVKGAIDSDVALIAFEGEGNAEHALLIVGYGTDENHNLTQLYCLDGNCPMPQNSHWNSCLYIMNAEKTDEIMCFHSSTRKIFHIKNTLCIFK